mmetsp:Transcript_23734/g.23635  ORF Transcript_23734/g.23635 Transcript_23734/m.23635 type:complete len:202 (-) Transcript_23734:299-904(-)
MLIPFLILDFSFLGFSPPIRHPGFMKWKNGLSNFFKVFSIWRHNSLVGENIIAYVPCSLEIFSCVSESSTKCCTNGTEYASVLPDPVSALIRTLLFCKTTGIADFWILVILLYPLFSKIFLSLSSKGSSSKFSAEITSLLISSEGVSLVSAPESFQSRFILVRSSNFFFLKCPFFSFSLKTLFLEVSTNSSFSMLFWLSWI